MKRAVIEEPKLYVGQKVWVAQGHDRLLAEVYQPPRRDQVEVLSFTCPGRSEELSVPTEQVTPATLISGQRVYIPPGDYWRHGRVVIELIKPAGSRVRFYAIALPDGQKAPLAED